MISWMAHCLPQSQCTPVVNLETTWSPQGSEIQQQKDLIGQQTFNLKATQFKGKLKRISILNCNIQTAVLVSNINEN